MRDFSYLRGSRTTLEARKWQPTPESECVSCGDAWSQHRQENDDTACLVCTCETFVADTSGSPDEVQRIVQWHHAESGEVIDDPEEIAELERRLALIGGPENGRASIIR
jgi:hypothetical protein